MTTSSFEILGKPVGGSGRAYIVAEVGINHGGDVALARHQILAAAEAGAPERQAEGSAKKPRLADVHASMVGWAAGWLREFCSVPCGCRS